MPGLVFSAITIPLSKFLQTQSLVLPIMVNALIAAIMHPFLCYALVYGLGIGYPGGAIATSISYVILGFLNLNYIVWSGKCSKCWNGFAIRDALAGAGSYLNLAVPSVVMICFEFWAFELLVLSSGLLPKPSVEVSLLSMAITLVNFTDMIPLGLAVAGRCVFSVCQLHTHINPLPLNINPTFCTSLTIKSIPLILPGSHVTSLHSHIHDTG